MGKLSVRRTTRSDQFIVEHVPHGTENWHAEYVTFSGHFGPYSPNLFATAPELLVMLRECRATFAFAAGEGDDPASQMVAEIDAVLAKAEAPHA